LTLLAYRRDITGVFASHASTGLNAFETVDYLPFHKVGTQLDRIEPVFVDVRSGRQIPVQLNGRGKNRYIQFLAWHPTVR